jgi:sugar phosphate isomerase/epimerase
MTFSLDRRELMTGLALTGLASAVGAAPMHKGFFARLNVPIGLQLYTLGEDPSKDLSGTLAKLATIGYRDLELPSLLGKSPADLRKAANDSGVKYSSIHIAARAGMGPAGLTLESSAAQVADALGTLGINRAIMPMFPFPEGFRPHSMESFREEISKALVAGGVDVWKRTAHMLNEKAHALKPHGITLGYHNHNLEFAPIGKTTGWEILTHETDAALVSFEVDIGWVASAGLEPIAFLKRNSGRIRQVHVKDLKASTKPNFALNMDPTEVGSGKLDWARILPVAYQAGARHFYVEQEPPFTMTRMEAAAKSFGFLDKLVA